MVSVIIPSYNSESTISSCLSALKKQTYQGDYEIILVDSSVDRTPDIVRQNFPEINFIHLERKTDPGTARNIGLKASSGDPVLFIDSDCIAESGWIEAMVRNFESGEYAAVGGSVLNGNDHRNHVAWAGYMAEFREFLPEYPERNVEHIPTCNLGYQRRWLEELNGFKSDYYPQEDLEFNWRLRKRNGRIRFDPGIRIYHNHRVRLKDFYNHQYRVGQITARVLQQLPLEGHRLARSKFLCLLACPILPAVKWWRTVTIFWRWQRATLKKHPRAALILAAGLLPWITGFSKRVWSA